MGQKNVSQEELISQLIEQNIQLTEQISKLNEEISALKQNIREFKNDTSKVRTATDIIEMPRKATRKAAFSLRKIYSNGKNKATALWTSAKEKLKESYEATKTIGKNSVEYAKNNKITQHAVGVKEAVKVGVGKPIINSARRISRPAFERMEKFNRAVNLKVQRAAVESGIDFNKQRDAYYALYLQQSAGVAVGKAAEKMRNSKLGKALSNTSQNMKNAYKESANAVAEKRLTAKQNISKALSK